MYNILIVDDEPIILSGIKFLINWDKNDCTIMDTAEMAGKPWKDPRLSTGYHSVRYQDACYGRPGAFKAGQ